MIQDAYVEHLVKRKTPPYAIAVKVLDVYKRQIQSRFFKPFQGKFIRCYYTNIGIKKKYKILQFSVSEMDVWRATEALTRLNRDWEVYW